MNSIGRRQLEGSETATLKRIASDQALEINTLKELDQGS